MNFYDLQQRLLDVLRQRLRSGEATERGLARDTGMSQPHLHNVLKGRRLLSIEKADEVLRRLHLDVLHLVATEELQESIRRR
jgi:transcriptional regulator with XRE-family HTH domain